MTEGAFRFGNTPFYFLRHGETSDGELGLVQGQDESVLSDEGRLTAWKAARILSPIHLRSIYSSPLRRAWETAEIIARVAAIPVTPLPGLMERNWGHYQGKSRDSRPRLQDPDGVERTSLFWARVHAAMQSIAGPLPVLVVAHSGVFRLLCRHAGLTVDQGTAVANGLVYSFDPPQSGRQQWRIQVVDG